MKLLRNTPSSQGLLAGEEEISHTALPHKESAATWTNPVEYLRNQQPDLPVLFFCPATARSSARVFLEGFPGLVTYAVKSNPSEEMILSLAAAGVRGFDCASPSEIELVRRLAPPGSAVHYNNPVRSRSEIAFALERRVRSFAVDSHSELDKLLGMVTSALADEGGPGCCEVSVRFKLPDVKGAAYEFGSKFGADPAVAAELLRRAAGAGFVPSVTFHPGTQCPDPAAWDAYVREAAAVAAAAGVRIARLNVGGGFPAHRLSAEPPDLEGIFRAIDRAVREAFGPEGRRPALVCEPGRALSGEACVLATRVRAVRDGDHVFLNDGIYGGLAELGLLGIVDRIHAVDPRGKVRTGELLGRVCFGPTCDSLDRLPGEVPLPSDLEEDDYVILRGMGAYSTVTSTRFNGFGKLESVRVLALG
jgi:ornithine decarboxylase